MNTQIERLKVDAAKAKAEAKRCRMNIRIAKETGFGDPDFWIEQEVYYLFKAKGCKAAIKALKKR